jgi:4-amino-4-deoxy-L-arabinose transferase-like glycosyltransferase
MSCSFLAAGRHPDRGYPDQPPLTPLILRLADAIHPGSLLALRLPSALEAALTVLLAGLMAHEMKRRPASPVDRRRLRRRLRASAGSGPARTG